MIRDEEGLFTMKLARRGEGRKREEGESTWRKFLPFAVAVAAVLAYANSLSVPFMFDDAHVIVNRSDIRSILPFTWGTRSIVDFTFRINYAVGQLNVADYHAVNLVIHIIAGLLFCAIVRRTLVMRIFNGRYIGIAPWVAVVSAVIWTVHPLQTESVTYICQRYESMMGMFYFLCLYCYIRGVEEVPDAGFSRWRVVMWFVGSVAAFALGMGSKEVMITAPLMIFLYDRVFGQDIIIGFFRQRRFLCFVLLCLFFVLVIPFWRVVVWSYGADNDLLSRVSPWAYLSTQFGVILHYLRLS
ncbi:MAG: hypothetical protein KAH23_01125, partial [Kiritimatiellae bacterium]|nr:hypothetical protein [Kiritimatiellia bacterium]